MSRVLDVLKKAPSALKRADEQLPQSEHGLNFPGKGFLTALVDTSGSELKRQRDLEDKMKHDMAAPLIQKYWTGDLSDEEREAVADQIKSTIGGGKRTKAFLDKMFEVGGQVHGTRKMLTPPPQAAEQVSAQAIQQAGQDEAEGEGPDSAAETGANRTATPTVASAGATSAPVAGPLAPPPAAQVQPIEGPVLPPPPAAPAKAPLNSALGKMFPTGMSEEEKIKLQHNNSMALQKQAQSSAIENMQMQIDAGRFEKNLKTIKSTEIDPATGKTMSVLRWYGSDGTLVKKDVLAEAPRNWASKPTRIFARDESGQIFSEMVDPLTGQRVTGTERRYDVLPPAGYLDKISSREAIFVDEDNIVHLEPLTTIRKVQLPSAPGASGGSASPLAPPPTSPSATMPGSEGGGAPAAVAGASSGTARPGAAAAAPLQTPQGGRELPGLYPAAVVSQSIKRATPIREAYTAMIGDPDRPDEPNFMKYAKIADDPVRREKLGKALQLTFNGIEQAEKTHGSLVNLFKLYAGIPAAEINAQLATYTDIIGDALKDDQELQQAYNATLTMFGNAVALRSLTGVSGALANLKTIENEIAVIGRNAFSSRDVAGKTHGLLRTAYNGTKGVPTITKKEKDWMQQNLDALSKQNQGTLQPPPAAGGTGKPDFPVSFKGSIFHFTTKAQADKFKADQGIK